MRLPSNVLIKTLLRAVLADESLIDRATIDGKEYATFSRTYKKGTEVVTLALPVQDNNNIVQADELPRSQPDIVDGRGGKSSLDTDTMAMSSEVVQKSEWVPPANASSGMKYPSMQDTFMRKRFEQARMKRVSSVQAETPVQAEPIVELKSIDDEKRVDQLRQASRQTESYLKNYTYGPTLPMEPSVVEEETVEYGVTTTRQPFALEYQEWKFLLHCCASLLECADINTHSCVFFATSLRAVSLQRRVCIVGRVVRFLNSAHIVKNTHCTRLCDVVVHETCVMIAWGNDCMEAVKKRGWVGVPEIVLRARESQSELHYDVLRVLLRGTKTIDIPLFLCHEYGVGVFDDLRIRESIGKQWYDRFRRLAGYIERQMIGQLTVPVYKSRAGKMWYAGSFLYTASRTETGSGGVEHENVNEDMG